MGGDIEKIRQQPEGISHWEWKKEHWNCAQGKQQVKQSAAEMVEG